MGQAPPAPPPPARSCNVQLSVVEGKDDLEAKCDRGLSAPSDVFFAERFHRGPTGVRPVSVVLLRVGVDTGCGGIHSPLFKDGSFEFVPIPDSREMDKRTYGNTHGRQGRAFAEYFPKSRRDRVASWPMHVDP